MVYIFSCALYNSVHMPSTCAVRRSHRLTPTEKTPFEFVDRNSPEIYLTSWIKCAAHLMRPKKKIKMLSVVWFRRRALTNRDDFVILCRRAQCAWLKGDPFFIRIAFSGNFIGFVSNEPCANNENQMIPRSKCVAEARAHWKRRQNEFISIDHNLISFERNSDGVDFVSIVENCTCAPLQTYIVHLKRVDRHRS